MIHPPGLARRSLWCAEGDSNPAETSLKHERRGSLASKPQGSRPPLYRSVPLAAAKTHARCQFLATRNPAKPRRRTEGENISSATESQRRHVADRGSIQGFSAILSDARITFNDTLQAPDEPFRQDRVTLTIYVSNSLVEIGAINYSLNSWSIDFVFGLGLEQRGACTNGNQPGCYAYAGLHAELVDVRVNNINIPIVDETLESKLRSQLGPFAGDILRVIFQTLGGLHAPESGEPRTEVTVPRCMFVPTSDNPAQDRANHLPKECPDFSMPDIQVVRTEEPLITLTAEECR